MVTAELKPFDARSARACRGWRILSVNKTGKAESRLNKKKKGGGGGVSDRNVKDYLHFAGRCDVVSEGLRWGCGGSAARSVPPFKAAP